MRKLIVALTVAVMALGVWCGVAGAMLPISQSMTIEMDNLRASGKQSNDYIDHSIIDLANIANGTVVTYTYSGNSETLTNNTFAVSPNQILQASNKITSFVFELTNQYHPDTDISVSNVTYELTVNTYTYGAMKSEAMWAIINGLPSCLNNPPVNSGDHSSGDSSNYWMDKYLPDQITTTIATATFSINSNTVTVSDVPTNQTKMLEMDVSPEIVGDRTFVPVRFLAYALGVPETGVQWDSLTQTATITNGDTTVELTIGNTTEIVNSKPVEMDVAPYIKEIEAGGRTMLPARWVAEPLGATVTWDETQQQTIIEFPQSQPQEQGQ